jgi:hypothetical protein
MSNVLIGIIGVILFIGLALAGALFLGPRFQESTNNSRAAANIQAVTQITNAMELYKTQEGEAFDYSRYPGNLEGTYLKSIPTIQGGGTLLWRTTAVTGEGTVLVLTSTLTNADGNTSKQVCEAIMRQSKGVETIPTQPVDRMGCYYNGSRYLLYTRGV